MAEHGWFVVTGAATGIMEAGHRGAGRERSMGLNIMLPFEQESNEVIRGDAKLVTMKYFFTRKLMFVKECDAVVCLPGGFGTLDEAFEVLTLLQTGKRELMPLVFLDAPGGTYWRDWLAFVRKNLLDGGMISPEDLSLLQVTDDVDETVAEILAVLPRVSQHGVRRRPAGVSAARGADDAAAGGDQREFADILTDGKFELQDAPPSEAADAGARVAHAARVPLQPPQSRAAAEAHRLDQSRRCGRRAGERAAGSLAKPQAAICGSNSQPHLRRRQSHLETADVKTTSARWPGGFAVPNRPSSPRYLAVD